MSAIPNAAATPAAPSLCTLRQFALYFLKLGTLGFGGPIALAGYMQRDLVEDRCWIAPEDYKPGGQLILHSGIGSLMISEEMETEAKRTTLFPGTLAYASIPT